MEMNDAMCKRLNALRIFQVQDDSRLGNNRFSEPIRWFLVDTSTAEHDVNWPGDLVSEHTSAEDASIAYARVCLEYALGERG
jgi:hypothetical protein